MGTKQNEYWIILVNVNCSQNTAKLILITSQKAKPYYKEKPPQNSLAEWSFRLVGEKKKHAQEMKIWNDNFKSNQKGDAKQIEAKACYKGKHP